MKLKSIIPLLLLTSFVAFSANASAADSSSDKPETITYFMQKTRSDAVKLPFSKSQPEKVQNGELILVGENFQDPETMEIVKKMMARQSTQAAVGKMDNPIPMKYEFSLVPTIQDGKILVVGTLVTYDKNKKFLNRQLIHRLLNKNEITTFDVEAAGQKWEVNMKFTY